jgi:hypothetical protein
MTAAQPHPDDRLGHAPAAGATTEPVAVPLTGHPEAAPPRDGEPGGAAPGTPAAMPAPEHPRLSLHLARWLRNAGLVWEPRLGDHFLIPDHEIERSFLIADMVIEVRRVPAGRIIAFNGTPEWALDAIMLREALWLPTEAQLRAMLDERFLGLERDVEGWAVHLVAPDGTTTTHRATTSIDAHANALLSILRAD